MVRCKSRQARIRRKNMDSKFTKIDNYELEEEETVKKRITKAELITNKERLEKELVFVNKLLALLDTVVPLGDM